MGRGSSEIAGTDRSSGFMIYSSFDVAVLLEPAIFVFALETKKSISPEAKGPTMRFLRTPD